MTVRSLPVLLALAAAIPAPLAAQARTPFDELPVVGVHVVGVPPAAARAGLDTADVRQRVERQLTRGGFRVASARDLAGRPDTPRLVVNVGFFTTGETGVYSVQLELLELVRLRRNGLETHAVAWSEHALGAAPLAAAAGATRAAASALVDLFLAQAREAALAARDGS
jgi:hypothetical protein